MRTVTDPKGLPMDDQPTEVDGTPVEGWHWRAYIGDHKARLINEIADGDCDTEEEAKRFALHALGDQPETDIACDDCGKPAGDESQLAKNATEARRTARRLGFTRVNKDGRAGDLCRVCSHQSGRARSKSGGRQ